MNVAIYALAELMAREMERAPGLAPGKSGFASRRLDDFGIARVVKWGDRRDSHPDLLVHSQKL